MTPLLHILTSSPPLPLSGFPRHPTAMSHTGVTATLETATQAGVLLASLRFTSCHNGLTIHAQALYK